VRWYLRYNLSFRDLVEMMEERGLSMAHTTIMRWVHQYGPELDERVSVILSQQMIPGESMKRISK
jgi:transposase, IS6 family